MESFLVRTIRIEVWGPDFSGRQPLCEPPHFINLSFQRRFVITAFDDTIDDRHTWDQKAVALDVLPLFCHHMIADYSTEQLPHSIAEQVETTAVMVVGFLPDEQLRR